MKKEIIMLEKMTNKNLIEEINFLLKEYDIILVKEQQKTISKNEADLLLKDNKSAIIDVLKEMWLRKVDSFMEKNQ